ncbi:MAG: GatB/YqeY domain-containing protein, partial [Kiloniellales bacterium]|nr:GatB/YqeY domain-containing protein [Kiloniellales bacterium]
MAIVDEIRQSITAAMKAKDTVRLDAARMTQAALKNREIEKGAPLDESEALKVIATLIKQRRESAEQFRQGNREELAEKEEAEIAFLSSFQPPQLSEAEIAAEVDKAIQASSAQGPQDMGKVMKPVMAAVAGRADGSVVRKIV